MKKLCSKLVLMMEDIKSKHENPHVNFDEVGNKVTKEFEIAKEEFKQEKYYPQLVYKFYFISSMYEILTVYDISSQLREHYLRLSKEALAFSFETKKRVKQLSHIDLASYSLFSEAIIK